VKNFNEKHEEQAYQAGRQARVSDKPLLFCSLQNSDTNKSWWVAGWHDQDMEFGIKVYVNKTL
jgi:ribosome modulation factor